MDEQYELQTHDVEDAHWWYRGRRRVLIETLHSLSLAPNTRILDAGCGSGRNMVELAAFGTVTGLELAPASIEAARARGVGEVVGGSLAEMPFEDASFDLAGCFDVLEHLEDDLASLRELRRVVRPGGRMLVTVPAYPWLWSNHDVVNHHFRRYTRRTLLAATAETGWSPETVTSFNSLLLPAAVGHRLLERMRRSNGRPSGDLESTPSSLNRLLERPLHVEPTLIRRGRRIPAGLSLLAIFR